MSFRCLIGLHSGSVQPAREIEQDIGGLAAFVCRRCGTVKETGGGKRCPACGGEWNGGNCSLCTPQTSTEGDSTE